MSLNLGPGHVAVAAGVAVLGVFLLTRSSGEKAPGFGPPAKQPAAQDDIWQATNPCSGTPQFAPNHPGYVYTPHRYPRACGGELTALIHMGFSPMRIPNRPDIQWMIAPPSEAMY